MPLLQVHLLEGRSPELKAELVRELTEVIHRHLGSSPERISVLLSEYGTGHWNIAGEPLSPPEASR